MSFILLIPTQIYYPVSGTVNIWMSNGMSDQVESLACYQTRQRICLCLSDVKGMEIHTHTRMLATGLAIRSQDLNHGVAKLHFLSSSYFFKK